MEVQGIWHYGVEIGVLLATVVGAIVIPLVIIGKKQKKDVGDRLNGVEGKMEKIVNIGKDIEKIENKCTDHLKTEIQMTEMLKNHEKRLDCISDIKKSIEGINLNMAKVVPLVERIGEEVDDHEQRIRKIETG